eukprot:gb/GECG01014347.1/.p1 GENE.gb/GECG01014347.1/~~gb/GECG01014347.1/.p1  ORF type:complete len:699 (+),score=117.39 gb/GECG01014347.1/:1-2097(+)
MNKSVLREAVKDDENPPPGYLYNDIAKMTHNDVTVCDKLAKYLVDTLKSNEKKANVQYRTLMTIKHVAKLARPEFKRLLQRDTAVIKERTQFRGQVDPLRGDALNKRVRDAASEAVQAIFDNSQAYQHSLSGERIAGMGSNSSSTGFSATGSPQGSGSSNQRHFSSSYDHNDQLNQPVVSTGTMQGIGNYDPKKYESKSREFMSKMRSAFSTEKKGPSLPESTGVPGYNFASNRGPNAVRPRTYGEPGDSNQWQGGSSQRSRGAVGGVWGSAHAKVVNSGQYQASGYGSVNSGRFSGDAGKAQDDGEYERRLVNDITAAAGVRPVPDPNKLRSFLAAVKSLSTETLLTAFDERLQSESPHIVQKALAVIEAMAKDPSCIKHKQHFADHCDEILALYDEAEKPSIRKQARNTLNALGVNYEGHMEGNASGNPDVPASGKDLLDVEGVSGLGQTGAPQAGGQSNTDDDLGELFDNTAAPVNNSADVGGGGEELGDMFGGLNVGGSSGQPQEGSFPWAASAGSGPLDSSSNEQGGVNDVFGGMDTKGGDDLFSGMGLHVPDNKPPNQQESGFSFASTGGDQEQPSGFSFASNNAPMEQNQPHSGFSFTQSPSTADPHNNAAPMVQPATSGFSFAAGSNAGGQGNWMGADEDGLLDNMQQPVYKSSPEKQSKGSAAPNGTTQSSTKAKSDDPFGFVDTEFQI